MNPAEIREKRAAAKENSMSRKQKILRSGTRGTSIRTLSLGLKPTGKSGSNQRLPKPLLGLPCPVGHCQVIVPSFQRHLVTQARSPTIVILGRVLLGRGGGPSSVVIE